MWGRRPGVRGGAVALLLLWPLVGLGQEGLGLDLTAETREADLRPRVAVVGPPRVAAALHAALQGLPQLAAGPAPEAVARQLSTSGPLTPEEAAACADEDCLGVLLAALPEADVVLVAQPLPQGLRLTAAERGPAPLQQHEVAAPVRPPQLRALLAQLLRPLAQPRARLTLTTREPRARVRLGAHLLGQGPLQARRIAPGPQLLVVEAEGTTPFQRELSPAPGETLEVEAALLPPPPVATATLPTHALPIQAAPREAALHERPGFYVGLAGVFALGVGLGLGASASSVQARAVDANGDGVLDVTRTEARSAQARALAANVLLGAGALGVGVGGAWLMLAPTAAAPVRAGQAGAVGGTLLAVGRF